MLWIPKKNAVNEWVSDNDDDDGNGTKNVRVAVLGNDDCLYAPRQAQVLGCLELMEKGWQ